MRHVSAGCEAPIRAAHQQNGQLLMRVTVTVGDAAAVKHHRMVEQRSVSVRRGLQPSDKLREQFYVEGIDLRQFFERLRHVAVMREGMVRFRNSNFIVRADTAFPSDY